MNDKYIKIMHVTTALVVLHTVWLHDLSFLSYLSGRDHATWDGWNKRCRMNVDHNCGFITVVHCSLVHCAIVNQNRSYNPYIRACIGVVLVCNLWMMCSYFL